MGDSQPVEPGLDLLLRGFLALVREAPTFLDKYRDAITDLDRQYAQKQHALETLDQQLHAELDRVAQQVDAERTRRLAAVEEEVASHLDRHATLLDDVAALEQKSRDYQELLAAHRAELDAHQSKTAQLVQDRQTELEFVGLQIAAARQEYDHLRQQHQDLKAAIDGVVAKLKTA